ncbi:hypothetical protein IAU60_002108 [Kwoniella sp. DSM 27419]
MAPAARPAWVVQDLASVLGLDEESIKEMVVPDLESYTHEARLRGHLENFLGTDPAAKAFTTRYISHRFPASTSSSKSVPQTQPSIQRYDDRLNVSKKASGSGAPSRGGSGAGSARKPSTPTPSNGAPSTQSIPDALNAAFGPGGRVYQKNRDLDEGWGRPVSGSGQPRLAGGSGTASGSHTPVIPSQRLRQPGAISVQVQHAEPKTRLEVPSPGTGGGSGSASRTNSSKGKSRGGEKIWDQPKSREVKRLEGIKEKLRMVKEGEGKVNLDEGVNCFCQARVHTLSSYTPLCQSCGLTICSLHPAHLPCPSCQHPLATPAQLARLILRLDDEIAQQVAKEERQREEAERVRLARLAAEAGGGAFPSLPGAQTTTPSAGTGGRKVLTIGAKGKGKGKSTITTTTYRPASVASPSGSRPVTPPPNDIMPRLRSNPVSADKIEKELKKLLTWRAEVGRPFGDLKAEKKGETGWKYKELEVVHVRMDGDGEGRRRKAKARRGENGREVPGAA